MCFRVSPTMRLAAFCKVFRRSGRSRAYAVGCVAPATIGQTVSQSPLSDYPTSPRRFAGDTLVIASHNAGKVREIADLLRSHVMHFPSAGDLGLPEPEETG